MPTGSDSPAAARARREAEGWATLAGAWSADAWPLIWADLAPVEAQVLPGAAARTDLERRGRAWGYSFETGDLCELALFAAGLANAEAEAWVGDDAPGATRAYADRRFFLADRVLPWLPVWFDVVGRCYPESREAAHAARDRLLDLAEEMRPAPVRGGTEGMSLPGHDGYGPPPTGPPGARVASLWGGAIVLRRTAESMAARSFASRTEAIDYVVESHAAELGLHYEATAGRWRRFGDLYSGSAGYWGDLAVRATDTAARLP